MSNVVIDYFFFFFSVQNTHLNCICACIRKTKFFLICVVCVWSGFLHSADYVFFFFFCLQRYKRNVIWVERVLVHIFLLSFMYWVCVGVCNVKNLVFVWLSLYYFIHRFGGAFHVSVFSPSSFRSLYSLRNINYPNLLFYVGFGFFQSSHFSFFLKRHTHTVHIPKQRVPLTHWHTMSIVVFLILFSVHDTRPYKPVNRNSDRNSSYLANKLNSRTRPSPSKRSFYLNQKISSVHFLFVLNEREKKNTLN